MRMEWDEYTISDIVELYSNNMLQANPEYQRGTVWNATQKQKLIDSVFRGYPIPLIYLHHIKRNVAKLQRDDFEIIDGQQRINALFQFHEGAYKTLDPVKDDQKGKFPDFLKTAPCPWARLSFDQLNQALKDQFLETRLSIAKIYTDDTNEVRDLFIRLQAGSALNAQETRDAWPGQFTDFILKLGGKPQIAKYQGHPFFTEVMKMKPQSDRGKTRALSAQICLLFFTRRTYGKDVFVDINANAIDNFYYKNIDFDQNGENAQRLVAILDKLHFLLRSRNGPALRNHEAIHLILLVDTLWDEYTRIWEEKLPKALDSFAQKFSESKQDQQPNEFWYNYGQWTRVNSDKAENIKRRHEFYIQKMSEFMGPIQVKDGKRYFGPLEREIIFFRDNKRCHICQAEVAWQDAEIHHLQEHQHGGETILDNGVLVHRKCHPR